MTIKESYLKIKKEMKDIKPIKSGYGGGLFVAISVFKGIKE